MKKIFTLALAACSIMAASAQKVAKSDIAVRMNAESAVPVQKQVVPVSPRMDQTFKNGFVPTRQQQVKKAVAEMAADTAFYLASPDLVYYGGTYPNGYSTYPMLLQPYSQDVTFYNLSTFGTEGAFGWTLDGENLISQDTDFVAPALTFQAPGYYMEQTPVLMMESGEYYYWGIENEDDGLYWMAFPDFSMPMTKCHTFTSPLFMEGGSDSYPWAFDENMQYLFGTGLDLSAYGYGLIDTIGTLFGLAGAQTVVDSISVMVMCWDASSVEIGNNFTLDICPVTISGNSILIGLDSAITSHTATAADVTWSYTGQGYTMGIVTFPVKATLDGEFWITLRGLNGNGANFGIWSDGADNFGIGDTYMISGGNFNNWFGMNINMSVQCTIYEDGDVPQPEAISNETYAAKAIKAVRNGQLVIEKGNKKFNVLGAEL